MNVVGRRVVLVQAVQSDERPEDNEQPADHPRKGKRKAQYVRSNGRDRRIDRPNKRKPCDHNDGHECPDVHSICTGGSGSSKL